MRKRGVAAAAAVCAILSTAGGGGGGGSGISSGAEADFITQFCDVYSTCCAAAGRPGARLLLRLLRSESPLNHRREPVADGAMASGDGALAQGTGTAVAR